MPFQIVPSAQRIGNEFGGLYVAGTGFQSAINPDFGGNEVVIDLNQDFSALTQISAVDVSYTNDVSSTIIGIFFKDQNGTWQFPLGYQSTVVSATPVIYAYTNPSMAKNVGIVIGHYPNNGATIVISQVTLCGSGSDPFAP